MISFTLDIEYLQCVQQINNWRWYQLTEKDLCDIHNLKRMPSNFYTLMEYAVWYSDYDLLFLLEELEDCILYGDRIRPVQRKALLYTIQGYTVKEISQMEHKTTTAIQNNLNRGYRHIMKHFGGDGGQ